MRSGTRLGLGVALLLCAPVLAQADEAKEIIQKAIKAHGGREVLKKNHGRPVHYVADAQLFAEGMELKGTMEITGLFRDKTLLFRHEVSVKVMDMDVQQSIGFDGKELWVAVNGQVVRTYNKKEDLDLLKVMIWAQEVSDLISLEAPDIQLSIIGEDKLGDTPVVGVRVSKKGHNDIALYFDQKSHLLRKIEYRSFDFVSRQEVDEQRIFERYSDFEGQKEPKRMTFYHDRKKFAELDVKEYHFLDRVESDLFSRPK
jgi:hypothetical protein